LQTTLLTLAIALIIALLAALVGPLAVDWNQYRPAFEAEATRILGVAVRVEGQIDARLLPTPTLRVREVTFGGRNDLGKVRADKLDVEFSLGALMRGEWRASELAVIGMAVDLGLDREGRLDLPSGTGGSFSFASLAIDRLNISGRIALHDASSRSTIELNDIVFTGDVRSLAGSVRGDGSFTVAGERFPFRVASGPAPGSSGILAHLNIDPGTRPISADLEGTLSLDDRLPRFDGAVTMMLVPPRGEAATPWKLSGKLKADAASGARLEQIEAGIGPEDSAIRLTGSGEARFGAAPLLTVALAARQLDADRFSEKSGPVRFLPALRASLAAIPPPPLNTRIGLNVEQLMLGGRPLQDISLELENSGRSGAVWNVRRLDLRAPGATTVSISSTAAQRDDFIGQLKVESGDFEALSAWLAGRSEVAGASRGGLRLQGEVTLAASHMTIDRLKAAIDGGNIEGRIALAETAGHAVRLDSEIRADQLDFAALPALARAITSSQQWPDEAHIAIAVGRAMFGDQELQPFQVRLGYDAASLNLEELRFGGSGMTFEGSGSLDREKLQGRLEFKSTAASLNGLATLMTALAPQLSSRLVWPGMTAIKGGGGPASASFTVDLGSDDKAGAERRLGRLRFDVAAPQLKATLQAVASPQVADLRAMDFDALALGSFSAEARVEAERASDLLALLGLDHVVASGDGAGRFEARASGLWREPMQVKVTLVAPALEAEAEGNAETEPENRANLKLRLRKADLSPLFARTEGAAAPGREVTLTSLVSATAQRLSFDELNATLAGSKLKGHVAITLAPEVAVEGDVGVDRLELAPLFALAAGEDSEAPEGSAVPLLSRAGWQAHVGLEAGRAVLPGGFELSPFSALVSNDGRLLTLEIVKSALGGGDVAGGVDIRPDAGGPIVNVRLELADVDAAALRVGDLALSKGRISAQMALASQGRGIAALGNALAGNGTVTLEAAEISGLDPQAFETAIAASDRGQLADDAALRRLVEPALQGNGPLRIAAAQIPFTVRDGRIRVSATALEARNARAIVAGGYDISSGQVELRVTLSPVMTGLTGNPPDLQVLGSGSPFSVTRSVDLGSFSSWLAVRAIDRETRRLDAIERNEAAPVIPSPKLVVSEDPLPAVPPRGSRVAPKPKAPPPPQTPPATSNPPAPNPGSMKPPPPRAAPLPPAVEIRPAPGEAAKPKPKPKPKAHSHPPPRYVPPPASLF